MCVRSSVQAFRFWRRRLLRFASLSPRLHSLGLLSLLVRIPAEVVVAVRVTAVPDSTDGRLPWRDAIIIGFTLWNGQIEDN